MILVCTFNNKDSYILDGKIVAETEVELYKNIVNKSLRLIEIQDDFFQKYFTQTSLSAFAKEVRKINPYLEIKAPVHCLTADTETMKKVLRYRKPEELVHLLLKDNLSLSLIQKSLKEVVNAKEEVIAASAKLNSMHLELSQKNAELEASQKAEERTQLLLDTIRSQFEDVLTKMAWQHGIDYDPEKARSIKVDIPKYDNILYIKEISRVKYTDTLIYYLQEIIKSLYGESARLLVLEPRDAYNRASLYKRCVPHTKLTYTDVCVSDIFCAGFQQQLVEKILANPGDVTHLIILDRTGSLNPYIEGKNVEIIVAASDPSDIPFVIPLSRVLSYNKETLHVKHIEKFDQLTSEEKLTKYSSMEVIQLLIRLMERSSR